MRAGDGGARPLRRLRVSLERDDGGLGPSAKVRRVRVSTPSENMSALERSMGGFGSGGSGRDSAARVIGVGVVVGGFGGSGGAV